MADIAKQLVFDVVFRADPQSLQQVTDALRKVEQGRTSGGAGRRTIDPVIAAQKEYNEELRESIRTLDILRRNGQITNEQAKRQLAEVGQAINKNALSLKQYNDRQVQLINAIDNADKGFISLGGSVASIDANVSRATNTLFSFGQIIQDAPFGIRGIANNIPFAVQGFQQLAASSGGAIAALRTLGATLLGPAGIIFAVGTLLPTALLAAESGFFGFGKEAKEAENRAKALADQVQSLASAEIGNLLGNIDPKDLQARYDALLSVISQVVQASVRAQGIGVLSDPILRPSLDALEALRKETLLAIQVSEAFAKTQQGVAQAAERAAAAEKERLRTAIAAFEVQSNQLRQTQALASAQEQLNAAVRTEIDLVSRQAVERQRAADAAFEQARSQIVGLPRREEIEQNINQLISFERNIRIQALRDAGFEEQAIEAQRLEDLRQLRLTFLQQGIRDEELFAQASENITRKSEEAKASIRELARQAELRQQIEQANGVATIAEGFFGRTREIVAAEALINTYASAVGAAKAVAGIPLVGPFLAKAAYAAALVSGLRTVRQIYAVEPGRRSGGGASSSATGFTASTAADNFSSTNAPAPSASQVAGFGTAGRPQINVVNEVTLDRRGLALNVREGERELESEILPLAG